MDTNYQEPAPLETGVMPPAGMSSQMNVEQVERLASVGLGIGMLSSVIGHKSFLKCTVLLAAGGYLLYRGITGNCPLSAWLASQQKGEGLGARTSGEAAQKAEPLEIKTSFIVNKPRMEVYSFWRRLENLPLFMKHLKRVEEKDSRRSHWTAQFPGEMSVLSWDAEIVRDTEGSLIAWQSLPGSMLRNAGEVKFQDALGGQGTEVWVTILYRPPAGQLGRGVAKFLTPMLENIVRDDIRSFKQYMEGGGTPSPSEQSPEMS